MIPGQRPPVDPVDPRAVLADDLLVQRLAARRPVEPGPLTNRLMAWRAEVDAAPLPEWAS